MIRFRTSGPIRGWSANAHLNARATAATDSTPFFFDDPIPASKYGLLTIRIGLPASAPPTAASLYPVTTTTSSALEANRLSTQASTKVLPSTGKSCLNLPIRSDLPAASSTAEIIVAPHSGRPGHLGSTARQTISSQHYPSGRLMGSARVPWALRMLF